MAVVVDDAKESLPFQQWSRLSLHLSSINKTNKRFLDFWRAIARDSHSTWALRYAPAFWSNADLNSPFFKHLRFESNKMLMNQTACETAKGRLGNRNHHDVYFTAEWTEDNKKKWNEKITSFFDRITCKWHQTLSSWASTRSRYRIDELFIAFRCNEIDSIIHQCQRRRCHHWQRASNSWLPSAVFHFDSFVFVINFI